MLPHTAVEISGLSKIYNAYKNQPARQALYDLDLSILAGSVFGLLGPNGAGKSTLINILAGLVRKTSGQVKIWGFDQDKNPRQSRAAIGVMPQELNLDPFFTPRAALDVQAGLYGIPKSQRRGEDILAMVGLSEKPMPIRGLYPVACAGAYFWQKPWCIARKYWFWMNPQPALISNCGKRFGTMFAG